MLAKLPATPKRLSGWLDYASSFEKFYQDNFGLRTQLLSIATSLKLVSGISPNRFALAGKEGWVFINTRTVGQRLIGHSPFQESELKDFSQRMEVVRQYLKKQNIVFVHFSATEKQSIYPEYLPASVDQPGLSRLDQLNEMLSESDSYVELGPVLLKAKAARPSVLLYHEIDSHWNCLGAYLSYDEVVRKGLISQGVAVSPLPETDFIFRNVSEPDRANPFLAKFWLGTLEDRDTNYDCLLQTSPLIEMYSEEGYKMTYINGERFTPEAESGDPTLLSKTWRSADKRGKSKPKAIIVRDSFASRLVPYFTRTFSEVIYIHSGKLDSKGVLNQIIEDFRPNVIIYEYAERRLDHPENILKPLEMALDISAFNGQL